MYLIHIKRITTKWRPAKIHLRCESFLFVISCIWCVWLWKITLLKYDIVNLVFYSQIKKGFQILHLHETLVFKRVLLLSSRISSNQYVEPAYGVKRNSLNIIYFQNNKKTLKGVHRKLRLLLRKGQWSALPNDPLYPHQPYQHAISIIDG